MIGVVLGNYRIVRKLGEGGMGVVYQAEHVTIGRKVAVKLLLPMFSDNHEIVTRFFNEARATSMIEHPALISVFDYGYHEKSAFLVMEYISGESLAARLAREPILPLELQIGIARQVAGALGAAHDRNIVHRDLKPDNVMLVADADIAIGLRVKVLDFGIAKLAIDPNAATAADGSGAQIKTRLGAVMGTPAFMSPEQCRGAGEVDARSDIYALGCMMFVMATGRLPFDGEGNGDIMASHIRDPIPPITNPNTPQPLVSLIYSMLAKTPDQRPQTMTAVIAGLDAIAPVGRPRLDTPGAFPAARPHLATTLSGSTGAMPAAPVAPPSRGLGKFIAVGGGVVVVAVLAIVMVMKHGDESRAASSTAATSDAAVVASADAAVASPDAPVAAVVVPARSIRITSPVAGAKVTLVDGATRREVGPVPATVELPDHDVQVEVAAPGYANHVEPIAATDKRDTVTVKLDTDKVKGSIGSTPGGAVVFDATNRRRGKTPFRVDLDRAGASKFRIVCAGYADQVVELSAKRASVSVKLTRDLKVPPASECE